MYALSLPRNREQFEYDPLTPPPLYLAPAPLPPSLPRASQLAARALDGQIELVVRAVGAVRVGVPLLHRRLVAVGACSVRACIVAGRRPWPTCPEGGQPNPALYS